jgi:hypothetical protein
MEGWHMFIMKEPSSGREKREEKRGGLTKEISKFRRKTDCINPKKNR